MKTLNPRWRFIALVPLVAIAILSIGNRTGAVPDQNKEEYGPDKRNVLLSIFPDDATREGVV